MVWTGTVGHVAQPDGDVAAKRAVAGEVARLPRTIAGPPEIAERGHVVGSRGARPHRPWRDSRRPRRCGLFPPVGLPPVGFPPIGSTPGGTAIHASSNGPLEAACCAAETSCIPPSLNPLNVRLPLCNHRRYPSAAKHRDRSAQVRLQCWRWPTRRETTLVRLRDVVQGELFQIGQQKRSPTPTLHIDRVAATCPRIQAAATEVRRDSWSGRCRFAASCCGIVSPAHSRVPVARRATSPRRECP